MKPPLLAALWASAALLVVVGWSMAEGEERDVLEGSGGPAGNDQVAEIMRTRPGRGAMADDTPATPPEEALLQFRVRDGFEMELVASEPVVTQPLHLSFDRRGRLWVVQYRQYQFPAGLKVVRYDQHLRAQFDKVPPPPPNHFPGADKITVFEDTTGDGVFDAHKDVITGLSIATAVTTGSGGIWVLNPPYLLFYPDADGDDVPDGDPEVCLSGFGLEDTHSVASSLQWGPDGWLYGVNGSTTTGDVSSAVTKHVKWEGQNVWRYHPVTKEFEIYAEGGGNTFSLEIDSKGRVFSGTNNGDTRGMHYAQGGYGKKNWGKHGPLTNPYAFGWHEHMEHEGDDRRFAQAFSIYEGGLFPEEYEGKIIAPNSLHNVVWVSRMEPVGSTYRTIDEENLVESPDRWFRPVCSKVGPDGALYIADWYDTRLSHVSPVDDWDKTSGRIYRVRPEGKALGTLPDLTKMETAQLIGLFSHSNRELRRMAVLELGERGDASVLDRLEEIAREGGQRALEALWALNLLGGLTDELAVDLLGHGDEHVRRWVVRLIGDRRFAGEVLGGRLAALAATEPDAQVRAQMASTAKRLPAAEGLPVVRVLLERDEDAGDERIPLLIWWAMESNVSSGRAMVVGLFSEDPEVWGLPMVRGHILGRLMQRFAMAGTDEDFEACGELLALAADDDARKRLMLGLEEAFQGLTIPELPEALTEALDEYQKGTGEGGLVLEVRRGNEDALAVALKRVGDGGTGMGERIALAKVLGEVGRPEAVGALKGLLKPEGQHALKRVALQSMAAYDDPEVARAILAGYSSQLPNEHDVRSSADRVLASRVEWARAFLAEIDAWNIRAEDVSQDVVQRLRMHDDVQIDALVEKHWPTLGKATTKAQVAEMDRVRVALQGGTGNAGRGEETFTQRCAVCHRLFEKGGQVGPDLTGYERGNLDFWLHGTVAPSLEIREGYQNYVARMKDGRVLTGIISAQDGRTVTLRDIANETAILDRAGVQQLEASPISLMPEGLLAGMTDEEVRDLFAYLRKDAGGGGGEEREKEGEDE